MVLFFLGLVSVLVVIYYLLTRQLVIIHTLVNSNLTKVQKDLSIALQRIESLEAALVREKE